MLKYVGQKILIAVATVFVLATATFFLMQLIPGDPFANDKVPVAVQEKQRAYYGLDKPLGEQYVIYMKNLLKGDLGYSIKKTGRTVVDIIKEAFPVSAKLGLFSLLFSEAIGILFGILCAQFRGKWPDYLLMLVAILGIAMPSMVLGPIVRYVFGVKLHWLPVSGWGSFSQMIMPAFVLGLGTVAGNTRSMRASMLATTTQDYVKTAKAKGLPPWKVVLRHQLKNSLVPIIPNLGVQIASVLMGSFVVESMFLIGGLGRYFVDSITNLDYPLIMGLTIFYGTFLVVMNLLVDILYGLIDPRIRVK
ncbi:MAG: ABC transporter permease [Lachnospiraceae bacterium]|nr:ABC transporter permease [Robinsoniella sp.]MDY3767544.1 ABC transporter permease [Lachnospiraceae bacterium]